MDFKLRTNTPEHFVRQEVLMFFRMACVLIVVASCSAVRADPPPERLVVATWNLEWFFDDHTGDNYQDLPKQQAAPSAADWEWKLAGVAQVIAQIKPTILALQEVENRRVLFYLTRKLKSEYGLDYSVAFIEGDDYFTEQDVAVLAQSGLVGLEFKRQTKEMFDSQAYYNVSKHIFGQFEWTVGERKLELLVVNVHLRAMPDALPLRKRQARLLRHWIDDSVKAGRNVIVLGDVNSDETFETTTKNGDLGTLRGLDTPAANDDLVDLFEFYKGASKETHLIHKQFDHILVTPTLVKPPPRGPSFEFKAIDIRRDLVIRGAGQDQEHQDQYWKIPAAERDVSDHYPVVAEFGLKP
jgi:endonuclease/exonuclease/phosphatase family metal-dependent hydrolase